MKMPVESLLVLAEVVATNNDKSDIHLTNIATQLVPDDYSPLDIKQSWERTKRFFNGSVITVTVLPF